MFNFKGKKRERKKNYCVSEEDESESLFLNFFLSCLCSMRSRVEPRYGGLGRTMLPAAAAARVRGGGPGGGGARFGCLGLEEGGSGKVVLGVTPVSYTHLTLPTIYSV